MSTPIGDSKFYLSDAKVNSTTSITLVSKLAAQDVGVSANSVSGLAPIAVSAGDRLEVDVVMPPMSIDKALLYVGFKGEYTLSEDEYLELSITGSGTVSYEFVRNTSLFDFGVSLRPYSSAPRTATFSNLRLVRGSVVHPIPFVVEVPRQVQILEWVKTCGYIKVTAIVPPVNYYDNHEWAKSSPWRVFVNNVLVQRRFVEEGQLDTFEMTWPEDTGTKRVVVWGEANQVLLDTTVETNCLP